MIRVGFVMAQAGQGWMGGINYLSNLINSVMLLPNRQIEPVLILPPGVDAAVLAGFPPVERLETTMVVERSPSWVVRRGMRRVLGRDVLFEQWLRRHGIDVLSHADHLGSWASLPTLCWIPDFQHRRLPAFFSAEELAGRDRGFKELADHCTLLIVSSLDAQRDLAAFAPHDVPKSRVLNFVSGLGGGVSPTPWPVLKDKYAIPGPYLHLPNQFWAHKNHGVVIEALGLLKAQGQSVCVLSTGHTKDARQPGYFDGLMARAHALGVAGAFRPLGLVPYEDLAGLMQHSAAVINPSLFEGWSTTVEESKSQGKTIILSDIPVHREQAPEFGQFFSPQDPQQLATLMEQVVQAWSPELDASRYEQARAALKARFHRFGESYQRIVVEACHGQG